MRRFSCWIAMLAALAVTGCVRDRLGTPEASVATLQRARALQMVPVSVGRFAASGDALANERHISIRGSTVSPAMGESFSAYLREVLIAELKAAGHYDPAATTVISADLTENRAGENLSSGLASLGATFSITRDGRQVYSSPQRVEIDWRSNFIAAIAVPDAFRHYSAMHSRLIEQLIGDPAFQAAVKAP